MVAIALPTTPVLDRNRRPLPAAGPGRGPRPALALVPAPQRTGRPLGRILVLGLIGLAVVLAGAYLARTPTPAPGQRASTYVATEGDTMWSIAVATAPAGEAASYVEELVAANGGAEVLPGESVTLPTP